GGSIARGLSRGLANRLPPPDQFNSLLSGEGRLVGCMSFPLNSICVLCLLAGASALCAAPKVVGGPFVVNVTSRGATVVWMVESEQLSFHPPGAAAKLSPAIHAERTELSTLQPNTRY